MRCFCCGRETKKVFCEDCFNMKRKVWIPEKTAQEIIDEIE